MATLSPTYPAEGNEPEDKEASDEKEYQEFTAEEDKMSDEDQFALVTKLDKMFQYALNHPNWTAGRKKMVKCFQYREGEQWTAAEISELNDRHQPDTVNNQIAVVVNKLVGDVVNQRVRLGYRGRNQKGDEDVAKTLNSIFLFIKQSNDLEFEERDMADDGFTAGMGALDVEVEFDDMAMPFIKVRHHDPLTIFPDPDCRAYDWNEGSFLITADWWKLDDAIEAYPQAELQLKGTMGAAIATGEDTGAGQLAGVDAFKGENYIDKNNERIRVIKVEYKKKERESLCVFGDGRSIPFKEKKEVWPEVKKAKAAGIEYRILDRLKSRICVGIYAGGILLEHKETPHQVYGLVPYFAYRRKTGEPYSLVTLGLSMQDAVNKRESKALALLTMNQVIAEKSAVDSKEEVQDQVAKPDGYIEVKDGALAQQRFQIRENVELATTQFSMHQRATEDLFKIMGIDPRMGQQTGEIRSGAGLNRKYAEASKPVATLFDNIRRTRKILARVLLDRVQNYYTPGLTFLITDEAGEANQVGITAEHLDRIKTGTFDVVVDELEDTETAQQEQINSILNILPQIIPLGPYWVKTILGLTNITKKDQIISDLEKLSGPPPVAPKVNLQANLDALEPEERAGVWSLMGRNDIAQQVMQKHPAPVEDKKISADLQKEQIKKKVDPAEFAMKDAELKQSQAEHGMKMEQMHAQHQVKMAEVGMKARAAEHQAQLDNQKHHMELEKMATQHVFAQAAPKEPKQSKEGSN